VSAAPVSAQEMITGRVIVVSPQSEFGMCLFGTLGQSLDRQVAADKHLGQWSRSERQAVCEQLISFCQ